MTNKSLLRYGTLFICDGADHIYLMHAHCIHVLCSWPKKTAQFQHASYAGLIKTKNNDKCIRCGLCRQGIPNKAFDFLERTAKLLAQ